ncbi:MULTISPECIES: amino acid ABC transporter permease [Bradyrhizobium]|uniref:Ectoine/hydroxyectoine ABC transporter permease subunit EhuC n=3 Tax=Bradyrhizobium TaxID=374 RepID=A0A410VJ71_9BRAD|nr:MULTISPECIES: amino acid ABC transporter permease [Bradyrhizobium]MCG2629329.1 amino acid ABC transporter permease [Bradyrhizobium zhengyangense]MCG2644610.1 amino acid ABC transporter permease [Bradyrhizobium zhengyangense]MCG2670843.1 amino acid ABC transporter permease [Bradyrhizobium zhengyangense]MDN4984475.1 amino acid ABC transporter permease [Bradyrhizobium sp. WYCCWR 13022]MDN5002467.1 amino acid ABC transporter permease [Bradyrhizobium sp. WYCCWR 12677]
MSALYEGRWLLLSGAVTTMALYALSTVLMFACALVFGIARTSKSWWIRTISLLYVEIFRGISLVVVLFWLYFVLPFFGVAISAFWAATLAIGMCFGAYGAEVVRTAIGAIPRGQYDAALAINMVPSMMMRRIILPQAMLSMIPPLGNLSILVLKATSVAALATVPELTFEAYSLNIRTFQTVPIYLVVMIFYVAAAQLIGAAIAYAERRLGLWQGKPTHGATRGWSA